MPLIRTRTVEVPGLIYTPINNRLYSMDKANGVATRVGTEDRFHADEMSQTHQGPPFFFKGKLYMCVDALYELSRTTGTVTRVGNAEGFGANLTAVNAVTPRGDTVYMIGTETIRTTDTGRYVRDDHFLGTLDVTTGVFTKITEATDFGITGLGIVGFADHDNNFFVVARRLRPAAAYLYRLDINTARASRVGNSNGFGLGEFFPQGLDSDGINLYSIGAISKRLFTIHQSDGTGSYIGRGSGLTTGGAGGLAFEYTETITAERFNFHNNAGKRIIFHLGSTRLTSPAPPTGTLIKRFTVTVARGGLGAGYDSIDRFGRIMPNDDITILGTRYNIAAINMSSTAVRIFLLEDIPMRPNIDDWYLNLPGTGLPALQFSDAHDTLEHSISGGRNRELWQWNDLSVTTPWSVGSTQTFELWDGPPP